MGFVPCSRFLFQPFNAKSAFQVFFPLLCILRAVLSPFTCLLLSLSLAFLLLFERGIGCCVPPALNSCVSGFFFPSFLLLALPAEQGDRGCALGVALNTFLIPVGIAVVFLGFFWDLFSRHSAFLGVLYPGEHQGWVQAP